MTSIPAYIKRYEGVVRVRKSEGQFVAKPIDAKTIQISYQIAAEPGGGISAWLINLFIEDGPYYSFLKMKSLLDDQYLPYAFEGIRD